MNEEKYSLNNLEEDYVAPKSSFDGTLLQMIGIDLLNAFLILITLSIYAPWAICRVQRWKVDHTIVDGRRLNFDGKGSQIIGRWFLWGLLIIVTFGIYALWVPIKLEQWKAEHTHFAG